MLGLQERTETLVADNTARVREDEVLVVRALERFEALGLGWHAAETRLVLEV